jgi:hypothetical protein
MCISRFLDTAIPCKEAMFLKGSRQLPISEPARQRSYRICDYGNCAHWKKSAEHTLPDPSLNTKTAQYVIHETWVWNPVTKSHAMMWKQIFSPCVYKLSKRQRHHIPQVEKQDNNQKLRRRPKGLSWWYTSIIITILNNIHHPVFCLKAWYFPRPDAVSVFMWNRLRSNSKTESVSRPIRVRSTWRRRENISLRSMSLYVWQDGG